MLRGKSQLFSRHCLRLPLQQGLALGHEQGLWLRLSGNVSELESSWYLVHGYLLLSDMLAEVVHLDTQMFRSWSHLW